MSTQSLDIKFMTRDGQVYDGRLSIPDGSEKKPAILVIPAIFGTDEGMQGLIEAYADDGFLAAAPDYFFRTMPGPTADKEAAVKRMKEYDVAQGLLDLEDALAQLRAHPRCNGKVAALGFCFGGFLAYLAATRFGADAVGAYHGTRIHSYLNEVDKLTVPTSLHYGADDPVIPMEQIEPITAALAGKPNCEVVVHKGGQHNFSMPNMAGYDANVAKAARDAVLACFRSL